MATYDKEIDIENDNAYFKLKERHIYGSSRVGVRSSDLDLLPLLTQNYSMKSVHYSIGSRTYELSNQLPSVLPSAVGNVLSVISDKVIPQFSSSTVISEMRADIRVAQDYSPFGVTLEKRNFVVDEKYRYGYQGSEKDDELKGSGNSIDFGARMYDPRIGRWLSLDPLAGKAPGWSPYRFCFDNPINFIDPDGRFETRKEARAYKKEHGIEGRIRRDSDGEGFNISNKYTGDSWSRGTQWEINNGYAGSDGIVKSAFIVGVKPSEINNSVNTFTNSADITSQAVAHAADDAANTKLKYNPKIPENPNAYRTISKYAKGIGKIATGVDVISNYGDAAVNLYNGNTSEALESFTKGTTSIGVSIATAAATGAAIGAWGGPVGLAVGVGISVSWAYVSNLNWW